MVSIPACHAGDRGSIPRRGVFFFSSNLYLSQNEYRILKKLVDKLFFKHIEAEIFGAVERSISGSFNLRFVFFQKMYENNSQLEIFEAI